MDEIDMGVGTTFINDGIKLKCIEGTNCTRCYLEAHGNLCRMLVCESREREDKKEVIFIEV